MASRAEMADDDLLPYPGFTEAAATNWLHRRFPNLGIEVIGMRAPSYPRGRSRTPIGRRLNPSCAGPPVVRSC